MLPSSAYQVPGSTGTVSPLDGSVCSFYYGSLEGKDALWGLTSLHGRETGSCPESLWLELGFCSLEVKLSKCEGRTHEPLPCELCPVGHQGGTVCASPSEGGGPAEPHSC